MTAQRNDEDPILDVVLDEIRKWAAGTGWLDRATTLSVHARTAAILTLVQVVAFCIAKTISHHWAVGQATNLLLIVATMLYVRHRMPVRRDVAVGAMPMNYATTLVAPALVTVGVVPFVLLVGIAKADGVDLAAYAATLAATLWAVRMAWKLAVGRVHASR